VESFFFFLRNEKKGGVADCTSLRPPDKESVHHLSLISNREGDAAGLGEWAARRQQKK